MRISIVGSGYVGTTIAACFADLGHDVVTIDIDESIVGNINEGVAPIHEPGLDELVTIHGGERFTATTDYDAAASTDVTFLALPTPSNEDGSIDTSIIETGATALGNVLAEKPADHTVVVKSTVVPTTTRQVLGPELTSDGEKANGSSGTVHLAMNPEFLREGSAVSDFQNPDKLVFGTETATALETLHAVYDPLIESTETAVVETGIEEAEMIKYANNAFLAAKVSLINEIGNICKESGVDTYEVADAIGLDHRISERFLRSGLGWGGSCFGKDVAALIATAESEGYDPSLLKAAVEVNDKQPARMLALAEDELELADKRIAVLGLAFKPGTDDVRNSRAIPLIDGLQERGAHVVAYDPIAAENMKTHFPDIEYAPSAAAALRDAHAAFVVTGWDEFQVLDGEFTAMATPLVIDGRRIIQQRDSITYKGLTW